MIINNGNDNLVIHKKNSLEISFQLRKKISEKLNGRNNNGSSDDEIN